MARKLPFGTLPILIRKDPTQIPWRVLQIGFALVCAPVIESNLRWDRTEPAYVVAGVLVGFCILMELLWRWRRRAAGVVTLVDGASVQRRARKESWSEPLSAYKGVLWREEVRYGSSSGGSSSSYRVTILELPHRTNPERTVALDIRNGTAGARARWEQAAATLNITALRQIPDGSVLVREAADLDQSLRDKARAGQLEISLGSLPEAPSEDATRVHGERYRARVRTDGTVRRMGFYIGCALPLFALIPTIADRNPLPMAAALCLPAIGFLYRRFGHYDVSIVGSDLVVRSKIGRFTYRRKVLPLDAIEEVWTSSTSTGRGITGFTALRVETDSASASFFALSSPVAAWLSHFIQAIVVESEATPQRDVEDIS